MQIILPNSILKKLRCHMLKAGRREIGGMLMGEDIGDQTFKIVEFSVDMNRGTPSSFVRDSSQHDLELQHFFEKTESNYKRFNYLGEWHTHPSFSVSPSLNDINSMQGIVNSEDNVDFAFLFISRLRCFWQFECSVHLFIKGYPPIQCDVIYEK
ncbi:TPA: Mov34/MPN/PAD-1 family protein [Providencia rettgeri]|nr:Mov34/MPN/PAD-1 family protein [Providencia rettgeri]ELR5195545.1 Mov34/MPN/PAD-1 family protein [Providencia rettgeri]HEC8326511.1 Mov34/MPN/PAD-1 family protein [Providencia rettgeri]